MSHEAHAHGGRVDDHPTDTHDEGHGHRHGLVDPTITRSREGVRVVAWSLLVLLVTGVVQAAIYATTGSVALLADLVHNVGDALTALPLAAAFLLRSWTAERWSGFVVVAVVFGSAVVSGVVAVDRLIHPEDVGGLRVLAAAGVVGFVGNEIAARIRLRGGHRLDSAALIADGHHARTDGFVSLGVVLSAIAVGAGFPLGDPLIGLVITAIILRISWQSFWTVLRAHPPHHH